MTHSEGFFHTSDRVALYYQQWTSSANRWPVVLVHGAGEHSGRYAQTAARLNQDGFSVYAFDLPGHGQSPGTRGHIARLEDCLTAIRMFLQQVSQDCPETRPILLGHSFGGLLSPLYAARFPETLSGLVLSSPLWGVAVAIPIWKRALAHLLNPVWPSLTMRRPSTIEQTLSHDPHVAAQYARDPLTHTRASVHFYVELHRALSQLPSALPQLQLPVLVLQAGDDRIASAEATTRLFPGIGSPRKKLIVYEGYYHEVLNEVGNETVLQDLITWLRAVITREDSSAPPGLR